MTSQQIRIELVTRPGLIKAQQQQQQQQLAAAQLSQQQQQLAAAQLLASSGYTQAYLAAAASAGKPMAQILSSVAMLQQVTTSKKVKLGTYHKFPL